MGLDLVQWLGCRPWAYSQAGVGSLMGCYRHPTWYLPPGLLSGRGGDLNGVLQILSLVSTPGPTLRPGWGPQWGVTDTQSGIYPRAYSQAGVGSSMGCYRYSVWYLPPGLLSGRGGVLNGVLQILSLVSTPGPTLRSGWGPQWGVTDTQSGIYPRAYSQVGVGSSMGCYRHPTWYLPPGLLSGRGGDLNGVLQILSLVSTPGPTLRPGWGPQWGVTDTQSGIYPRAYSQAGVGSSMGCYRHPTWYLPLGLLSGRVGDLNGVLQTPNLVSTPGPTLRPGWGPQWGVTDTQSGIYPRAYSQVGVGSSMGCYRYSVWYLPPGLLSGRGGVLNGVLQILSLVSTPGPTLRSGWGPQWGVTDTQPGIYPRAYSQVGVGSSMGCYRHPTWYLPLGLLSGRGGDLNGVLQILSLVSTPGPTLRSGWGPQWGVTDTQPGIYPWAYSQVGVGTSMGCYRYSVWYLPPGLLSGRGGVLNGVLQILSLVSTPGPTLRSGWGPQWGVTDTQPGIYPWAYSQVGVGTSMGCYRHPTWYLPPGLLSGRGGDLNGVLQTPNLVSTPGPTLRSGWGPQWGVTDTQSGIYPWAYSQVGVGSSMGCYRYSVWYLPPGLLSGRGGVLNGVLQILSLVSTPGPTLRSGWGPQWGVTDTQPGIYPWAYSQVGVGSSMGCYRYSVWYLPPGLLSGRGGVLNGVLQTPNLVSTPGPTLRSGWGPQWGVTDTQSGIYPRAYSQVGVGSSMGCYRHPTWYLPPGLLSGRGGVLNGVLQILSLVSTPGPTLRPGWGPQWGVTDTQSGIYPWAYSQAGVGSSMGCYRHPTWYLPPGLLSGRGGVLNGVLQILSLVSTPGPTLRPGWGPQWGVTDTQSGIYPRAYSQVGVGSLMGCYRHPTWYLPLGLLSGRGGVLNGVLQILSLVSNPGPTLRSGWGPQWGVTDTQPGIYPRAYSQAGVGSSMGCYRYSVWYLPPGLLSGRGGDLNGVLQTPNLVSTPGPTLRSGWGPQWGVTDTQSGIYPRAYSQAGVGSSMGCYRYSVWYLPPGLLSGRGGVLNGVLQTPNLVSTPGPTLRPGWGPQWGVTDTQPGIYPRAYSQVGVGSSMGCYRHPTWYLPPGLLSGRGGVLNGVLQTPNLVSTPGPTLRSGWGPQWGVTDTQPGIYPRAYSQVGVGTSMGCYRYSVWYLPPGLLSGRGGVLNGVLQTPNLVSTPGPTLRSGWGPQWGVTDTQPGIYPRAYSQAGVGSSMGCYRHPTWYLPPGLLSGRGGVLNGVLQTPNLVSTPGPTLRSGWGPQWGVTDTQPGIYPWAYSQAGVGSSMGCYRYSVWYLPPGLLSGRGGVLNGVLQILSLVSTPGPTLRSGWGPQWGVTDTQSGIYPRAYSQAGVGSSMGCYRHPTWYLPPGLLSGRGGVLNGVLQILSLVSTPGPTLRPGWGVTDTHPRAYRVLQTPNLVSTPGPTLRPGWGPQWGVTDTQSGIYPWAYSQVGVGSSMGCYRHPTWYLPPGLLSGRGGDLNGVLQTPNLVSTPGPTLRSGWGPQWGVTDTQSGIYPRAYSQAGVGTSMGCYRHPTWYLPPGLLSGRGGDLNGVLQILSLVSTPGPTLRPGWGPQWGVQILSLVSTPGPTLRPGWGPQWGVTDTQSGIYPRAYSQVGVGSSMGCYRYSVWYLPPGLLSGRGGVLNGVLQILSLVSTPGPTLRSGWGPQWGVTDTQSGIYPRAYSQAGVGSSIGCYRTQGGYPYKVGLPAIPSTPLKWRNIMQILDCGESAIQFTGRGEAESIIAFLSPVNCIVDQLPSHMYLRDRVES